MLEVELDLKSKFNIRSNYNWQFFPVSMSILCFFSRSNCRCSVFKFRSKSTSILDQVPCNKLDQSTYVSPAVIEQNGLKQFFSCFSYFLANPEMEIRIYGYRWNPWVKPDPQVPCRHLQVPWLSHYNAKRENRFSGSSLVRIRKSGFLMAFL